MTTEPQRIVVTVDGIDGSGKSIFARRLAEALGPRAVALAVDDLRRPVDWTRSDRSELEIYYDERYDLPALDRCLADFLAGAASCRYTGFDGAREQLGDERTVPFAGCDVLIVEGVFVARLGHAAEALCLYIDITRDEARRRVQARDLGKGRTPDEVLRRLERRYLPAHDRYSAEAQPKERAAVVVDNQDPGSPRLVRARWPEGPLGTALRGAVLSLVSPR